MSYARQLNGLADQLTTNGFKEVELVALHQAQMDSFPQEFAHLQANKPASSVSWLLSLYPEFDPATQFISVGGCLRAAKDLEQDEVHPIVLDISHPTTKLIIQDYNLHHPGPERIFLELEILGFVRP